MKLIALSGKKGKDKYAKVNKEGYIKAMRVTNKWNLAPHGYVKGWDRGKKAMVYLHRVIMDRPDCAVDHVSGDKLDCRQSNLRTMEDWGDHIRNRQARNPGRLGINWNAKRGKWMARIMVPEFVFLGWFVDKDDARRAYRDAALKLDPLLAIRHAEEWSDL